MSLHYIGAVRDVNYGTVFTPTELIFHFWTHD